MPSTSFVDASRVSYSRDRLYGAGGFADVYKGIYNGMNVALKSLRSFAMLQPSLRENARKVMGFSFFFRKNLTDYTKEFCREAVLWFTLPRHENILPFYGIYEGTSRYELFMLSPWMALGNISSYLENLARRKSSSELIVIIDEWVSIRFHLTCMDQFDNI